MNRAPGKNANEGTDIPIRMNAPNEVVIVIILEARTVLGRIPIQAHHKCQVHTLKKQEFESEEGYRSGYLWR